MDQKTGEHTRLATDDDGYWLAYLAGCIGLWFAYLIVLLTTIEQSLWEAASDSLANMVPPALLGLAARPLLKRIWTMRPLTRVAALAGAALVYALLWYVLLAVTLGLANLVQAERFRLAWITGIGRVWQVYQGMLLFALIATFASFWEMRSRWLTAISQARPPIVQEPIPDAVPILIKTEDGLKPVEAADILAIEALDDSSVVVLRKQRFVTRTPLAQWEKQLATDKFLRVHRSWLINLTHVLSFEPVGQGRMQAHLPSGLSVPVSRAGSRLVRDLQV